MEFKGYNFSASNISVNDVQTVSGLYREVAPGKKVNDIIYFDRDDFEYTDIGDYTDIKVTFEVSHQDTYYMSIIATETVHIYPYGEDKATAYVREPQASDNIIMNNEYVTVIVTGHKRNNYGYTTNLFLVNKTSTSLLFTIDDASINGYMVDIGFIGDLFAGACLFRTIYWDKEIFEDNSITNVEELEFTFYVDEGRGISYDEPLAKETIILNP